MKINRKEQRKTNRERLRETERERERERERKIDIEREIHRENGTWQGDEANIFAHDDSGALRHLTVCHSSGSACSRSTRL